MAQVQFHFMCSIFNDKQKVNPCFIVPSAGKQYPLHINLNLYPQGILHTEKEIPAAFNPHTGLHAGF